MNWIGLQTFVQREIQRFFRVGIQTLITPWISAALYIFIFGFVVGSRIPDIAGVRYIDFVLPGLVMMNIIASAFSQTSSSLYFQRFTRHIEELLVAPFSYGEMVIGYMVGGVVRGVIVGLGVYAMAIIFGSSTIAHLWLFIAYSIAVSIIFSFLGLLVGLWSEHFEHLAILNTFVITPLSFLGGIFNSIHMLPEKLQPIVRLNPFFYFVDGMRYAMIGVREASPLTGGALVIGLIFGLGFWVWYLFKTGYKLRT